MAEPDAVTFDLDETLVRYERSPGEVLEAAFDRCGIDPVFAVEAYYARYDEFAARTDSMAQLRAECFGALAEANGYDPATGRAVAESFEAERDQSNVDLLPGAADALDALAAECRVGIVTNGARDAQQQKIDAVGLDHWVDTIVVASHETPPKPHPKPFEAAMDALDSEPSTTVHVGDSLDTDVAGGAAAGLETIWLSTETADTHDPTYQAEELDAIPSLLLGV